LNYGYALAEFACKIALRANGLDPDIGWLHRDAPYRASAALDLLEVLRPQVDGFLLDLFRTRTFFAREFVERESGQVRLAPTLAKALAESLLPLLETDAEAAARSVTEVLSRTASSPPAVKRRGAPSQTGRIRVAPIRVARPNKRVSACRICGLVLADAERQICDECLPDYDRERTEKLSTAGKATLAAMRASPDDPARSQEATAKKREKSRSTSLAMRAWEREHGRGDPGLYEKEVLPQIQGMSVPELIKLTGLNQFHCWKVRKGERRLHARHWDALRSLVQ
jgi:hypothetical protein